jgi:D-cysteine desulfhydrase
LFKRDDLTGAGLGGNKLRGLEFLIADALARGCDCLVTGAGPQSNWTMLAALACLRYGIEPHIVCYGAAPERDEGNLRLHRWLGVDVRFTGIADRSSVDAGIEAATRRLRAAGRRPYPVPRGGATALGALGYLRASRELAAQLAMLGRPPAGLWLATGSGGTQAGLVAGAACARAAYQVVGVTVSRTAAECRGQVRRLAVAAAELGGLDGVPGVIGEPEVRDGWIGPGYGIGSQAGQDAARLVAVTEGVFLDPVFAAKAMAALIAECRAGRLSGPQIFLVSGGAPTLFAGPAA